ncbi:MAG: fucose isomerase [Asgard group archaeon]|nr:fucose isomerase [Asgard group archaeon]
MSSKNMNVKEERIEEPKYRIGIISFTDPRSEVKLVKEREDYIKKCHNELISNLKSIGYTVINPQSSIIEKSENKNTFGINNQKQIEEAILEFAKQKVGAILIGCFAWNEPKLPLELVKQVDVPVGLVTKNNPLWPGVTAITSTGATFWELSSSYYIKNHNRFVLPMNGKIDSMLPWLKAACAVNHLKYGKLLLWGGTPALNMDHLNDDIPTLKRFIIEDIITQDQYLLVKKAEGFLNKQKLKIEAFKKWLIDNKCLIEYDDVMLSEEILDKQIALYLASKEILKEFYLQGERIIGTSIKCQPELSVDYGITPCLLPAFLPFGIDHEGPKPIIPTVCEGDIKGLLTSVILFALNKEIPPLFGDLKIVNDDYFVIANCGAASAYYGGLSGDPKISLQKCTIKAQCQGIAGGAFGFRTPTSNNEITYARLIRLDTNYIMQIGTSKIVTLKDNQQMGWGITWPHTAIKMKVPLELMVKAIGTNHLSLTLGNYVAEMKHVSKLLGIPIVLLDNEDSIQNFLDIY